MINVLYLFKDINFAYQLTLCILSIGLFIASLEDLKSWPIFNSNGLLSWKVAKLASKWSTKGYTSKIIDFILTDKVFKISIYLRFFGSILLFIFSILNIFSSTLLFSLFFLKILVSLRNPYGLDGAYQMYLVILFASSIGSLFGIGSEISSICLYFITGELILSYFIAGITKLISPVWYRSFALNAIFSTKSYGHSFFYQLFSKMGVLSISINWIIFIFEVMFFIILFINPIYAILFLVIGFSFHLFNAVFMGLNDFLFAFSAAYPALIYTINQAHSSL